jgi:hypothetical protein
MDKPMGQVKMLDQKMNAAGYLRLMTCEPLSQNMSNRLDWIHNPGESKATKTNPTSVRKRFLSVPLVKRLLLGAHDRIFRWYYE